MLETLSLNKILALVNFCHKIVWNLTTIWNIIVLVLMWFSGIEESQKLQSKKRQINSEIYLLYIFLKRIRKFSCGQVLCLVQNKRCVPNVFSGHHWKKSHFSRHPLAITGFEKYLGTWKTGFYGWNFNW